MEEAFARRALLLYLMVGAFGLLLAALLGAGATTQTYRAMIAAALEMPLELLVASVPFVLLLGIAVDGARIAVLRLLPWVADRDLSALRPPQRASLHAVLEGILEREVSAGSDAEIIRAVEDALPIVSPLMEPYALHDRWMAALLWDVSLIGGLSCTVVAFRMLHTDPTALDRIVVSLSLCAIALAGARIGDLRQRYSLSEAILVMESGR